MFGTFPDQSFAPLLPVSAVDGLNRGLGRLGVPYSISSLHIVPAEPWVYVACQSPKSSNAQHLTGIFPAGALIGNPHRAFVR